MRYIQRDPKTGEVTGHFANEQPYATESVPDDHPDILGFYERRKRLWNPDADVRIAGTVRRSAFARGLVIVLAEWLGISEADLLHAIVAAAKKSPGAGAELEGT